MDVGDNDWKGMRKKIRVLFELSKTQSTGPNQRLTTWRKNLGNLALLNREHL
jgi:hypothetical protein